MRRRLPMLRAMVRLARPKQWIKNAFVLAPLLFSGEFLDVDAVRRALTATFFFCLASSAIYVVNDLHDVEQDRLHPDKSRTRPLAAGDISVPAALALVGVLCGMLIGGWFLAPDVLAIITIYLALGLAYTYFLKQQPVVDIFSIALGFVLRVYAGAVAIDVLLSGWMFVTTLCLALYLAAIKRRQEQIWSGQDGRSVLNYYSAALTDRYAQMSATGTLVFYSLFVVTARPQLFITVPLVLFGLFRYWYVVERHAGGESPTDTLFADWQLLLAIALWVGVCVWVLSRAQL